MDRQNLIAQHAKKSGKVSVSFTIYIKLKAEKGIIEKIRPQGK